MIDTIKACTSCGNVWMNLGELIRDEHVHIIGYQPAFKKSDEGVLFFAHRASDCGTTIALPVSCFVDLYDGPQYADQLFNTEACSGLCHSFYDFDACSSECTMRWVRDVIQMLKNREPEELLARLERVDLKKRCA